MEDVSLGTTWKSLWILSIWVSKYEGGNGETGSAGTERFFSLANHLDELPAVGGVGGHRVNGGWLMRHSASGLWDRSVLMWIEVTRPITSGTEWYHLVRVIRAGGGRRKMSVTMSSGCFSLNKMFQLHVVCFSWSLFMLKSNVYEVKYRAAVYQL